MPGGWEGNHRSRVALAVLHRLKCCIHLLGDEHPAYALLVGYGPFTFTYLVLVTVSQNPYPAQYLQPLSVLSCLPDGLKLTPVFY